jgi:SAM-dependent methyltransferase
MLREGLKRYPTAIPVAGTSEALPCRQSGFDGLVSRYAAHHFEEPETSLLEMRRILNPEGTLVFQDLVVEKDDELGSIVNRIAELRDPSHEQYYSPKQWGELLRDTGFTVLDRQQFLLSLTYGDWLNRSDPVPDARDRIESLFDQLDELRRERLNLTTSGGRPDTFEYPVAMFRCVPAR